MDKKKEKFIELLSKNIEIKIDLGCGPSKKEGYIGIDILEFPEIDFVADFNNGLPFIPDNSVDEIISSHLLEHIENLEFFLSEIHRVLKPNGIKKIIVPHFSNPYFYSDYTHKRFFGLYSMDYFSGGSTNLKRKVPTFYNNIKFIVTYRKLKFSAHPFYIRNKIMALFTIIFNITPYMQELYEGTFSGLIPCHEVHYEIIPIKSYK